MHCISIAQLEILGDWHFELPLLQLSLHKALVVIQRTLALNLVYLYAFIQTSEL